MKRPVLAGLVLGLFSIVPAAQAVWTTAQRITTNPGWSENAVVAVDSKDIIHVVWDDDSPGNGVIFYKRSADGGTSWSIVRRLTWISGWAENPAITIDSNDTIHIVWDDSTFGFTEIFYKQSLDGGTTWSEAKRLTVTSGHSSHPAIAADPSNIIHVVWEDFTPGN